MKDSVESIEDYLERILMLMEEGNTSVRAIDIAQKMNFSKPSVSIAIKKMESLSYVTIDEKHHIHLTEEGLEIAKKTYERHQILGNLLISLGVDPEIAFDDACKIEHDLSQQSFDALKNAYLRLEEKKRTEK